MIVDIAGCIRCGSIPKIEYRLMWYMVKCSKCGLHTYPYFEVEEAIAEWNGEYDEEYD